jgi:hypothetical protein
MGRRGPRVGEGVRTAGRHEHDAALAAAGDLRSAGRLPGRPVAGRPDPRLESEQIEFALQDVEQLLGLGVPVRPDVEAGPGLGLER